MADMPIVSFDTVPSRAEENGQGCLSGCSMSSGFICLSCLLIGASGRDDNAVTLRPICLSHISLEPLGPGAVDLLGSAAGCPQLYQKAGQN